MINEEIKIIQKELRKTAIGHEIIAIVETHLEEVFYLVSSNRKVNIVWQRNHGPAFLKNIAQYSKNPHKTFNKKVKDVSLQYLLLRMADALQENGSKKLFNAISTYSTVVFNCAIECNSLNEVYNKIESYHKQA